MKDKNLKKYGSRYVYLADANAVLSKRKASKLKKFQRECVHFDKKT